MTELRKKMIRRDRPVQKRRNPLRCQPMTVSGLTVSKGAHHSDQIRDNQTQNRRSFVLIAGRFWVRFKMASCCRKAKFSRVRPCFLREMADPAPCADGLRSPNALDGFQADFSLLCRLSHRLLNVVTSSFAHWDSSRCHLTGSKRRSS
jgi:hypothetical protein